MRRIIEALAFLMIALSSGAFIQQLKDGGAREPGLDNVSRYFGVLNIIPLIWVTAVFFTLGILLISKKIKRFKISWPVVILIAYCFTSIVWATFPIVAFRSTLFIAAAYLLITTQVALYGWSRAVNFFSLALFLILFCSLVAVIFIPDYGISVGFEDKGKWQGVFDHKNGLGNFTAFSFLIFSWQYQQKQKMMFLMAAIFAVVLAIGSRSGTAYFNIAAILCIFIILKFNFTRILIYRLRYTLLFVAIASSLFLIFIAINSKEFDIFEKNSSFTGRNLIWIYIIAKSSASPWIGYGLEQLSVIINKNNADFFSNVGFLVGSSHNGFLETIFSLGLIGLFLIIVIFTSQFRSSSNQYSFALSFSYVIAFIILNTLESRMVGFNIFFIGLIYVIVVTKYAKIYWNIDGSHSVKY